MKRYKYVQISKMHMIPTATMRGPNFEITHFYHKITSEINRSERPDVFN